MKTLDVSKIDNWRDELVTGHRTRGHMSIVYTMLMKRYMLQAYGNSGARYIWTRDYTGPCWKFTLD